MVSCTPTGLISHIGVDWVLDKMGVDKLEGIRYQMFLQFPQRPHSFARSTFRRGIEGGHDRGRC